MYVLLTKKGDGWDVPVRWEGSNFRDENLKPLTGYTLTKHALPNGHLPFFGVFPLDRVKVPTGKRATEEIAKAAADRLTTSRTDNITQVKSEAQNRILAVAPEWRQRNFAYLQKQVEDKTKANAETSTASAAATAADASTAAAKAHTDAKTAEAAAKTAAEADGATDDQKAAYVTAQEDTKTKAAAATKAEADSATAADTAKTAKSAHDKEKADMAAQETMWGKVEAIRDKSDAIEAKVAAMDQEAVDNFNASDESHWK